MPATLITNSPEHDLSRPGRSGVKAIYTTAVTMDDGDHTSIVGTAHLFQKQITEKAFEVRISAVADTLFAVAIRSESELWWLDWRRDFHRLSYEVINVPQDVTSGIQRLMHTLSLRFGALDFVVTQEGQWWFYEINPNGQWAWIEDATGLPIAAAIADALTTMEDHHDRVP